MRLRVPIYGKVLLWLMFNLLLLLAMGGGFLWMRLPVGLEWVLAGEAGQRLDALGEVLTGELRDRPESEWDEVLARYDAAHGLVFTLFRNDGTQAAGKKVAPTDQVLEKLVDKRRPDTAPPQDRPSRRPEPPPPRDGPPPQREERGPPREGAPPERAPPEGPPPSRPPRADRPPPRPRFLVRTDHPRQYWAGIHLNLAQGTGQNRHALSLVLVSASLTGGGMFVDTAPLLALAVCGLVLSALVWLPLIGGMTRAIRRLNVASRSIAQGRFDIRVPEARRDELGELASSVNAMAAQLGQYMEKQRRLTADVAHELCSPIARMQMALGVVEQRSLPAQQSYIERLGGELQHMARLVEEVLSFSKAASLPERATVEEVRLAELVREIIAREAPEAQVTVDLPPDLRVRTLREALDRALANVLRNAVRYAGQAGPIEIRGQPTGQGVEISVRDHGPGVPEEALPKLFEPFYRPEAARGRHTGGSGLGLAIVRRCLEACRGGVEVARAEPTGLCFTLQVPDWGSG